MRRSPSAAMRQSGVRPSANARLASSPLAIASRTPVDRRGHRRAVDSCAVGMRAPTGVLRVTRTVDAGVDAGVDTAVDTAVDAGVLWTRERGERSSGGWRLCTPSQSRAASAISSGPRAAAVVAGWAVVCADILPTFTRMPTMWRGSCGARDVKRGRKGGRLNGDQVIKVSKYYLRAPFAP